RHRRRTRRRDRRRCRGTWRHSRWRRPLGPGPGKPAGPLQHGLPAVHVLAWKSASRLRGPTATVSIRAAPGLWAAGLRATGRLRTAISLILARPVPLAGVSATAGPTGGTTRTVPPAQPKRQTVRFPLGLQKRRPPLCLQSANRRTRQMRTILIAVSVASLSLLAACGSREPERAEGGAATGAATGATVGLVGGPVGVVAGGLIGGAAGAATGAA